MDYASHTHIIGHEVIRAVLSPLPVPLAFCPDPSIVRRNNRQQIGVAAREVQFGLVRGVAAVKRSHEWVAMGDGGGHGEDRFEATEDGLGVTQPTEMREVGVVEWGKVTTREVGCVRRKMVVPWGTPVLVNPTNFGPISFMAYPKDQHLGNVWLHGKAG